ncbi:AraC family transcriptional regulator [Bacillus sp. WLY-B-L8]|uniref:AraC family transcriptional regulator n=1 Tax=Bacillus multifaciens TaxID=3068506 RepID=UPI0027424E81|nr:AraC family transcriptional regulator [Bacillus sp. WLY-B-L8]MDP7979313.1 AraC family transcriptional regulator [Bacillus sp. WLY-B-L8]
MNNDYQTRIETVIKYIEAHYAEKINLDSLAQVSNFSKHHFSKIFKAIIGETPMSFVNKKRLQKSVYYLTETNKSILEIGNLCGFESASTFHALFKKHFHIVPTDVRKNNFHNSNISLYMSKNQEEMSASVCYANGSNNNLLRRIWTMNITIKELPDYEVAYVRHVGSYLETFRAWSKLGEWAHKHGIDQTKYSIGISLDDPNFVDEYACRYDACVTIPKDFYKENNDDIQYKTLQGGTYALYQFYDTLDKFALAYQSIFGQWLPNSEYDADDKPCLEFCMNNPATDPEGKAKVDLYVPIKKRGNYSVTL